MENLIQILDSLPKHSGEIITPCKRSACIFNDKDNDACKLYSIQLDQNGSCLSSLAPHIIKEVFDDNFAKELLQRIFGKNKKKRKKKR